MADHPNAAKIRAAAEEMERGGDMMSLMAELLDDDVVWHEIGRDEPIRGKEASWRGSARLPKAEVSGLTLMMSWPMTSTPSRS